VRGLPYEVAGRMGSLLGACQVAVRGNQKLKLDLDGFRELFEREFGSGF